MNSSTIAVTRTPYRSMVTAGADRRAAISPVSRQASMVTDGGSGRTPFVFGASGCDVLSRYYLRATVPVASGRHENSGSPITIQFQARVSAHPQDLGRTTANAEASSSETKPLGTDNSFENRIDEHRCAALPEMSAAGCDLVRGGSLKVRPVLNVRVDGND